MTTEKTPSAARIGFPIHLKMPIRAADSTDANANSALCHDSSNQTQLSQSSAIVGLHLKMPIRAADNTDANANSALAPCSGIYTVAKSTCVLTQVLSFVHVFTKSADVPSSSRTPEIVPSLVTTFASRCSSLVSPALPALRTRGGCGLALQKDRFVEQCAA